MSRIRRYRWLVAVIVVVLVYGLSMHLHLAQGVWDAIRAMHGG